MKIEKVIDGKIIYKCVNCENKTVIYEKVLYEYIICQKCGMFMYGDEKEE